MKSSMIRSTVRLLIPLSRQSEAIEILNSVSMQARLNPGCSITRLYRDVEDERALLFEELWDNEKSIVRHLASNIYRRVLLVIEMAEEFPEIRFDTITDTSGIEAIKKARKQVQHSDPE